MLPTNFRLATAANATREAPLAASWQSIGKWVTQLPANSTCDMYNLSLNDLLVLEGNLGHLHGHETFTYKHAPGTVARVWDIYKGMGHLQG